MELVEKIENILSSHQKMSENCQERSSVWNTAEVKHFANDPFADTDEQ